MFKHLAAVIARKDILTASATGSTSKLDEEILRYKAEQHELDDAMDPLEFWVSVEKQFPLLSMIASDILVIPASSAPIERVFSTSGESCMGKRNQLSGKNLEREVLLKKNKELLREELELNTTKTRTKVLILLLIN